MMDEFMNYLSEDNTNIEDIKLDTADESAVFLAALQDVCTPEEYNQLVMENATELELYGLIHDAAIVTEGVKIVKHKITKQENLNREQSKAALRLAKKANSAEWKKYSSARSKMLAAKQKIFVKFGPKAKQEARKIVQNSKRKASAMPSVTGKSISDKMDQKIKEIDKK